jgi:hypothetical protein
MRYARPRPPRQTVVTRNSIPLDLPSRWRALVCLNRLCWLVGFKADNPGYSQLEKRKGEPRAEGWTAIHNCHLTRLITFKIFINLLTATSFSLNIRTGSRRERQRRTVTEQAARAKPV